MHESKYACLQDKEHGLTYYEVPVDGSTDALVEEIRNMFIARMKDFGYIGFSHDIDNEFHYRSTYVYVANEIGTIVMTSRITNRPIGKTIPFEMGIMENGNSYSLQSYENVIDINTYVHVKEYYEHSMPLLAAGFGRHLDNLGVEKAFCLYDVKNFIIKKAYISIGFIPSKDSLSQFTFRLSVAAVAELKTAINEFFGGLWNGIQRQLNTILGLPKKNMPNRFEQAIFINN